MNLIQQFSFHLKTKSSDCIYFIFRYSQAFLIDSYHFNCFERIQKKWYLINFVQIQISSIFLTQTKLQHRHQNLLESWNNY
jgi:hypothetical protein